MATILAHKDATDVIRMSNELANALPPSPRVKHPDDALRTTCRDDAARWVRRKGVDGRLLFRDLGVVERQERCERGRSRGRRGGAGDVPELDLTIESAGGDPALLPTRKDDQAS